MLCTYHKKVESQSEDQPSKDSTGSDTSKEAESDESDSDGTGSDDGKSNLMISYTSFKDSRNPTDFVSRRW